SISDILKNPDDAKLLTQIELPSLAWFYEHIDWVMSQPDLGKEVFIGRYGKDAWDDEFTTFDGYVYRAQYPLHIVIADHIWLKVFTVDKRTRRKRRRLWLTVFLDVYSRCIIGIVLMYDGPGIANIQT